MGFWYIVWLVFSALYVVGGYVFTQQIGEPSAIVPMFVMYAVLHIFLMPAMILNVLNIEGKTQLWLYNPQSSLSLSLYISVWVIFLWTIYHSLGKYPAIRNFRWLAVIVVWMAYNLLETLLAKLNIIRDQLFSFGINLQITPSMKYGMENGWSIQYTPASVPIVPLIMYTAVAIVIFLIAGRLLDRKVEV